MQLPVSLYVLCPKILQVFLAFLHLSLKRLVVQKETEVHCSLTTISITCFLNFSGVIVMVILSEVKNCNNLACFSNFCSFWLKQTKYLYYLLLIQLSTLSNENAAPFKFETFEGTFSSDLVEMLNFASHTLSASSLFTAH